MNNAPIFHFTGLPCCGWGCSNSHHLSTATHSHHTTQPHHYSATPSRTTAQPHHRPFPLTAPPPNCRMGDLRHFQMHIYGTYAILHKSFLPAHHAAWKKVCAWGIAAEVAGEAVRNAAKYVVSTISGDISAIEHRINHTMGELNKAAEKAVDKAVDKAIEIATVDRWKIMATEAARASLECIIINEETIYSEMSTTFQGVKTADGINRREMIDAMLTPNLPLFRGMNLGGRCWYLARMWSLIAESGECKKSFFDLVSRCSDPVIDDFVSWITSPGYLCADFVKLMQESMYSPPPPPLLAIIYGYLAGPSADSIRRKILELI